MLSRQNKDEISGYTLEYFQTLHEQYESSFRNIPGQLFVRINSSHLLSTNFSDYEYASKQLINKHDNGHKFADMIDPIIRNKIVITYLMEIKNHYSKLDHLAPTNLEAATGIVKDYLNQQNRKIGKLLLQDNQYTQNKFNPDMVKKKQIKLSPAQFPLIFTPLLNIVIGNLLHDIDQ